MMGTSMKREAAAIERPEIKRWSEIETSLSLGMGLSRLTKDELLAIRQQLGVAKLSSKTKPELIEATETAVLDAFAAELEHMDAQDEVLLRELIMDRNGAWPYEDERAEGLLPLLPRGLLFPGTIEGAKMLVMPLEAQNAMLRHGFQLDTGPSDPGAIERIKLTRGLLHYYGRLTKPQLHKYMEQYTKQNVPSADYYAEVMDEVKRGNLQYDDELGIFDAGVGDFKWLYDEQQARRDIPYCAFTKGQLLEAGDLQFVDKHPAYKAFATFLEQRLGATEDDADEIAAEIILSIQERLGLQDVVGSIQNHFQINELKMLEALVERVVELMNNSRQWTLKGHTPRELSAMRSQTANVMAAVPARRPGAVVPFRAETKVGRNDPCPCGSGKKAKKCCGA
ncbi:SEC-C motif-containing protein [Paenibacillus methanolicus]|uniref:SEC-C motif-containing protein n=1 Tax=Paenibacillus methanolicus TaxID=582686 RepID=A0A5S5BPT5_9BACL|nr:SEC-C motif-containing protein [Paenibacillus methanolicus]